MRKTTKEYIYINILNWEGLYKGKEKLNFSVKLDERLKKRRKGGGWNFLITILRTKIDSFV